MTRIILDLPDDLVQQLATAGESLPELLREFLSCQERLKKDEHTNLDSNPQTPIKHRIIGLHQGQGSISNDFADPLPEEFWTNDRSL